MTDQLTTSKMDLISPSIPYFFKMEKNSGQKGQALLVILLVMVVGLTIGLSLATRSVTDVKISSQIEQSSRAFSAAEAGIEAVLKGEAPPASPVPIGDAFYTVSMTMAGGTDQPLPLGKIGVADTYTVWLASHDSAGDPQVAEASDYDGASIDICWNEGAMETNLIYKTGTAYRIQRGAYDPNAGRRNNNKFADVDGGVNCGGTFTYGKRISLPSPATTIAIGLRLRPFYSETNVGVAPLAGQNLPSQGIAIISSGTAGNTTRKVSVLQSYHSLPAIFDYVLFSGTGVNK